jgi:hypothetical protein
MPTFAPFLADSLEGFYKDFLSFLVNKGVQAHGRTKGGIKGIKGGKYLSHLFSLYSCLAYGWRVCIHLTTLQRVLPIAHQHGAKRAQKFASFLVCQGVSKRPYSIQLNRESNHDH